MSSLALSEQNALIGLGVILVVAVVLIGVIIWLNPALGLHTLCVFLAIWSVFFAAAYVALVTYSAVTGTPSTGTEAVAEPPVALSPLSDDFQKALDAQLAQEEPEGVASAFKGDD
jgi:hypothetical protein